MITAYSVSGNVVRVRTLVCVILYGFFPVINGLFNDDIVVLYTVSQKMCYPIVTIISLNLNRFSKFFYCRKNPLNWQQNNL